MRKFTLTIFLAIFFAMVAGVSSVQADYTDEVAKQLGAVAGVSGANYATPKDPRDVAVQIIQLSLGFIGILFTGFLIYAGFLVMLSSGDEEKVKKGKNIIKYCVIGIVVIMSAYGITEFVNQELRKAQQVGPDEAIFSNFEFSVDEYMNDMSNNDPLNQDVSINNDKNMWDNF